jgi:SAM-dependent methyltransferase
MRVDKIIDVGAGTGVMLEEIRASGIEANLLAIEPTPALAKICRQKKIETFEGFASEAALDPCLKDSASFVVSFEVIEHVVSPIEFLNALSSLIIPGGYVMFTGLCGSGFDILVLGEHSNSVSPPHHLNFLSRNGVSELLKRCGLTEVFFTTPGVLDVDIIKNTFAKKPQALDDDFLRSIFEKEDDALLSNFQEFITNNDLSSHMWVLAQKPL